MGIKILAAGIILSLIIRIYFILNGSEVADIHSLKEMGELAKNGINPYLALNYNSYPPLAIYIEILTLNLSSLLNIPFYIVIKFWPNLADLLITFVLYKFLTKKGTNSYFASLWSLGYFLNPISIIISSAHGQIDSIPTLLIILAIYLLTFYTKKIYIILSFILLGLSISIKPNPLILLPIFLLFVKGFSSKIIYSWITFLPLVILFFPFIEDHPYYVVKKVFNYSGVYDFGISGILRGVNYFQTGNYQQIFSESLLNLNKGFYLICLLLVTFLGNSKDIVKKLLIAYLIFFAFYLGISAQYLSWILPFAVLLKDKMIIPYSFTGIIAILGFYLFINPQIIISQFSIISPYQSQSMTLYFIGNLLFWIVTLIWVLKIAKGYLKTG